MNLALPKNNIKGISRLRHLAKRYYNKIFKIRYSPTTLPLLHITMNLALSKINIKEISRLRHLIKNVIIKMAKTNYSPTTLPPTTLLLL